jgi:tripartite-type tricarboxylate transporter receptor subunit TctC
MTPVGAVVAAPFAMVINLAVPVKTVPEFIAYAKSNPGSLSMASAGIGSGPHLAGELFKMMAAVNMVHVPYRGQGPALTDLLGTASGIGRGVFVVLEASVADPL